MCKKKKPLTCLIQELANPKVETVSANACKACCMNVYSYIQKFTTFQKRYFSAVSSSLQFCKEMLFLVLCCSARHSATLPSLLSQKTKKNSVVCLICNWESKLMQTRGPFFTTKVPVWACCEWSLFPVHLPCVMFFTTFRELIFKVKTRKSNAIYRTTQTEKQLFCKVRARTMQA